MTNASASAQHVDDYQGDIRKAIVPHKVKCLGIVFTITQYRVCFITTSGIFHGQRALQIVLGNLPSYLGSVRVRPSLEINDAISVTGAGLCVLFHRPLLQLGHGQVGVVPRRHVRVLCGQAGCEADMLPHQTSTAASSKRGTRVVFY